MSTIKAVEPLAKEVQNIQDTKEIYGLPIGRTNYNLRPRSQHENHISDIA